MDLARKTGWAVADIGKPITCGSVILGDRDAGIGEQLYIFEQWLGRAMANTTVAHVAYYMPIIARHDDVNAARRKFGQSGIIDMTCAGREILTHPVADQTVVAWLTGRARWGTKEMTAPQRRNEKKQAVQRAVARYGVDHRGDDDAADAAALLLFVENKFYPREHVSRGLVLREAS